MRKAIFILGAIAFISFMLACFYVMGVSDRMIANDTPVAHDETPCYSATLYESGREVIVQKSHRGC